MRRLALVALFVLSCGGKSESPTTASEGKTDAAATDEFVPNDTVIDHQVKTLEGETTSLASYRGKAVLVVNVASECGYTPQYAGLQSLYGELKERGLEVLAFPSDDFGNQEPGSNEQIRAFVDERFHAEFPMFDKVHAVGPDIAPLYKTLSEQTGKGIKGPVQWNFTKFLVAPDGRVVARFEPKVEPNDPKLRAAIEATLPKSI